MAVERCEAELGAEIAHDYDEAAASNDAASNDAASNDAASNDGNDSCSETNSNKGGVA